MKIKRLLVVVAILAFASDANAQNGIKNVLSKVENTLSARYNNMDVIDTAYISRPATKWTVTARMNVSGTKIEAKGIENSHHFKAELEADKKAAEEDGKDPEKVEDFTYEVTETEYELNRGKSWIGWISRNNGGKVDIKKAPEKDDSQES